MVGYMGKGKKEAQEFKGNIAKTFEDFSEKLNDWWEGARQKLSGLTSKELEKYDEQFEKAMEAGWKKMSTLNEKFDEELEKDDSTKAFKGACKRLLQGMQTVGYMVGAAITSLFLDLGGARVVEDPAKIMKGFQDKIEKIADTRSEVKATVSGAATTAADFIKKQLEMSGEK